ncbi:hypothetical protein [Dactylosporangium cerinum]
MLADAYAAAGSRGVDDGSVSATIQGIESPTVSPVVPPAGSPVVPQQSRRTLDEPAPSA